MRTHELKAGVIYTTESLLPLSPFSRHYPQGDAKMPMVIADNENFVKVKTIDGYSAIASDELNLAVNVIDKYGNEEYYLKNRSNYLRCKTRSGEDVYFTDEEAADANNFKFSVRLGTYYDETASEFYGHDTICSYHSAKFRDAEKYAPSFVNESDEYIFGVEVEKVDFNLRTQGKAYELFQTTGWKKEEDGSLGSEGYELVSPRLPLYDNSRIEQAIAPVRQFINGKSNDSCGGHFNLSKKDTNSNEMLEGIKGFVPMLYALYPNRLGNRYCQAKKWRNYFGSCDKYSAFYRKNDKVLEIRLFSRVTNVRTLMWRIKLMQMLLGDFGNNLNQFILKLSNFQSPLYAHFKEQYDHREIALKIRDADKYGKMYACGTVSKSIKIKVNERFALPVFPEVWTGDNSVTL